MVFSQIGLLARSPPSGQGGSMIQSMNADAKRPIKTIVFADDDRFFLEAITEILTANGYVVHTAQDGLEALTLIRQVKPDCIILDVVLPKLDGGQVSGAVRLDASLPFIPIIVISSLSPADYIFFPDLSADAFVAKGPLPTTCQNILKAVSYFEEGEAASEEGRLLGYDNMKSRRLVNELLLERRFLRAIFEVLAPGALVLNPDGRIVMANQGACGILEAQGRQLVGELFASLPPLADQKKVQDLLMDFGRSEEPIRCQTTFRVGTKVLTARLASILEEKVCTGLVVILEGDASTPAMGA
jgi:CheY-like chemotaxis protein